MTLDNEFIKQTNKLVTETLKLYQDAFLDVAEGQNYLEKPEPVCKKFNDLNKAKIPITSYPFTMQLVIS